jgi:hypothetical protein
MSGALVLADRQLFRGAHESTIRTVFIRRGILKAGSRKRAGYDPYARTPRPTLARPGLTWRTTIRASPSDSRTFWTLSLARREA